MVDFHTHILPQVDDGSKSLDDSVEMVRLLAQQGVGLIAATPHFYADNDTVSAFLQRRDEALGLLVNALPSGSPRILPGAEVSYYEGISRLDGLRKLCFDGCGVLLMEMPMARWHDSCVRELLALSAEPDVRLVIAHGERYLHYQSDDTVNALLQNDVLIQTNASTLLKPISRIKALKLLKNGVFHIIGSDCHNTSSRPPNIGDAYKVLRKKLGNNFVDNMQDLAYSLIDNK